MVPIELAELGTGARSMSGTTGEAVVVAMPFIDPKKEIAKRQPAAVAERRQPSRAVRAGRLRHR
jgi:hypothetical protein